MEYELSLGQSFFGQPAEYCTVRYRDDFKPSQACRSGAGNLRISGNQVSLELPNSKASHPSVQFEGVLEHGKGGLDYVLLCDEDGFRLEALAGHVHDVRHIRNSNGPAVIGQSAAVNGEGPAVSHPQAIQQQPATETETEHTPKAMAAAGEPIVRRCQTSESAAAQVLDRTPEQNALAPIQLSDSQSACEQRDDVAARQTDSQPDSACSEEASLDTSPSHPLDDSEAHAATLEQLNSVAAHSSHRSSSGQTAVRKEAESEHHPSGSGADRGSSSSSGSESDSEGDDDSCDDSCDNQSPATDAQERSNEVAAAVQEVHLSEEERQFLGLSNAPDGQTEYI